MISDKCERGVEQLWRDGDVLGAVSAADRLLAGGNDIDFRAAGVAAAAPPSDGALLEAAARWRAIASGVDGGAGVGARGRAALAGALAGDVAAAAADLAEALAGLPQPAPRGLAVLLDGVAAALEAVRGGALPAATRLAGLAAVTVPSDALAAERWDELAVAVTAAGGDDRTARAMLAAHERSTPRRALLAAWLDLRAGRLTDARRYLAAAGGTPVLRRNAVLAAAVSVGLARRAGDDAVLATTWHRVAPVVVGADVEPLLLDVWGELSVAATLVSPMDGQTIGDAIAAAVSRSGSPSRWSALDQWWRLERAVAVDDRGSVAAAAARLERLPDERPTGALTAAALAWDGLLNGRGGTSTVVRAAELLADVGRRREASVLCGAAAERAADPAAARALLASSRGLAGEPVTAASSGPDGLSPREREVGALIVDGLTQKEIGGRLFISPKTVEQHAARLRQKLDVSNRAQLVAALRSRLPADS